MHINGVEIEKTFAEAFPMIAARVVITAATSDWAATAGRVTTGYATSIIGCDAEAGVECSLSPDQTPDGRPGISLLLFAFNQKQLEKSLINRIGQCVLTCPTTACYNGITDIGKDNRIRIGGQLRFFGDGFQSSKQLERSSSSSITESPSKQRFWRIPVMDGEFVCEDYFGTQTAVAGGNFLILGTSQTKTLQAAQNAVDAIAEVSDCILPFPGGIVRSGSKVGSQYATLRASTNDAYCPTIRGITDSQLPETVNTVYEIVIDGLTVEAVTLATRVGAIAACTDGITRISAGNYGGDLGPHHFHLQKLLMNDSSPN